MPQDGYGQSGHDNDDDNDGDDDGGSVTDPVASEVVVLARGRPVTF